MRFSKGKIAALAAACMAVLATPASQLTQQQINEGKQALQELQELSATQQQQKENAPAVPSVPLNTQHLFDTFGWGRMSRFLRRREPVWIGYPRPQNHFKYLVPRRRGTNGGTSRMV